MTDAEILAKLRAAEARTREADATEPRARAVGYDAERDRIVIELTSGAEFSFPPELAQGLRGGTPEQLADVDVYADGEALRWETLNTDFSVPGLLTGIFGGRTWMREHARRAGRVRSEAKAAAARANGRKGGRPRKSAGEAASQ